MHTYLKLLLIICLLCFLGVIIWFFMHGDVTQKTSDATVKRIGISQFVPHPVFDEVKNGIKFALEKAGYTEGSMIVYDFQNAQGDMNTNIAIAQKFSAGDYDLFVPLGTPVSQALVKLVKDKPIVFGMVTDPISAGLVASLERPGGNVTGTSDVVLFKETLELMRQLVPNAKTVGIVYNPGDASARYALEQTKKAGEPMGFVFVTASVSNTSDIVGATRSLINKTDALYLIQDNIVESGQDALIKVSLDARKPVVAYEQSAVERGALAALGTNYRMVGEKTGEIIVRVLKGEHPSTIPVTGVTDAKIFLSTTTAKTIGITLPTELLKKAEKIY